MSTLILYTEEDVLDHTPVREGETKLGQRVHTVSSLQQLEQCPARFVLLGLPEDIGVRANLGTGGTQSAWIPALTAIMSMQSIGKFSGDELAVLGHIDFSDEMNASESMNIPALRELVGQMDTDIAAIVSTIFAANKIPVIIGGGHNNAYPILKAAAGILQPLSCINIDAHSDFRRLEGRHSGNGFSYAFEEGYLHKYVPFGLQESYSPLEITKRLRGLSNSVRIFWYDQLFSSDMLIAQSFKEALDFTNGPCGLEIDLDSMANVLSSAGSPVGFSVEQVRKMIGMTHGYDIRYLHLPEGAVKLANGREDPGTAKLLATLAVDFMKAHTH